MNGVFYKCVHFKGEAGAFVYYEKFVTLAIQFKEYKNGEIIDYFKYKSKIEINIQKFMDSVSLNDLIKIEDSKFCFIALSTDNAEIKLMILSNYVDEKIKIRYYLVKAKNYYLYRFSNEFMLNLYNELIVLASINSLEGDGRYGTIIIFSYPNSTDFNINLTNYNTTNPIIKFYEKCKIENNLFGHIFKGIQIIDFSMGLKLIREDNKKEISKNTLIPNNISVELFFTKEIVNLQKNARIEYAMVLTEPEYEKYNQYASTIDNDYCKENGIDNCNDEKNYFKKKSYIGRTSYCDIIINSEEFINECDEHCIICSKSNNLECLNCEYNYELSDNDKKKCIKINKIESTEIPSPISESIKEGFKTTNILSDIAYISQEKANTPIEITNIPTEITNTPTEIINTPTEIINTPTEIINTPTEIINNSTEIIKTQMEITNTPTEIINNSTEIIKTQMEITNTPTEITNTPTEITNTPTEIINNSTEIIKTQMEITNTPTELTK